MSNFDRDEIEQAFARAFAVVSRLPDPLSFLKSQGQAAWPDIVRSAWQDYADDRTRVSIKPSPDEIDPACEVMLIWPVFVQRDMCREVLFARAAGFSYRSISELELASRRRVSHETIRAWHHEALDDIRRRLSEETTAPARELVA